jgi:hypothetical protein
LLERANFAPLTVPLGLEDALSQVANTPVDRPPVDGVPVELSLGFDCRCLHLSAPRFARFTTLFKRFTRPASALVSSQLSLYPAGYTTALLPVSLCLSAASIGFSGRPVPVEVFGFPYGRLTD